jgi:hypothetical protein
MKGSTAHRERMVWGFLLSAAAACLASGAARATCNPTLPISAGSVPCYIKVQPIDVGVTTLGTTVFAPFNTTSETGNPNTAGMPLQSISAKGTNIPKSIPDNSTSPNPIGFVVDPKTGLSPGETGYSGTGMDVTRVLLNNIGVELVWFPMLQYAYPTCPSSDNSCTVATQDFSTLTAGLTSTGITVATGCPGTISGTTLTITAPCATGALGVYDILSGGTIATTPAPGTFISVLSGTGSGGAGTYTVYPSQMVTTSTSISATSGILSGQAFLQLADQVPSTAMPPTAPCAISQMTIPPSSPCGSPSPSPPLSSDPGTINLFFVEKLNPPGSGGTLYGLSLLGNNGVAIGSNTFFAPSPLQARPDTIAHELLHDLGIDHVTYGAGPYNPRNATTNPNGGILPPFPATPTNGQCDPTYPACGANLMTTGALRTEPGVVQSPLNTGPIYNCVLGPTTGPGATACNGLASLYNGLADQVAVAATTTTSSLLPSFATVIPGAKPATTTQLPTSQQDEVLTGGSGLLIKNPPLVFSGLADPIPYETTKAQLDTRGSATGRAIFDLSGPVDGKPGETLVAWVLTLPEEQTFARSDGFHIVSQSRKDLIQDVKYYPNPGNNPLKRNIAYQPGADNDQDNPSIEMAGSSPCTSATAECLVVKFQPPGLGRYDSISFSESIVKSILFSKSARSGGAPITQDELCKAKITYLFSDGFMTTSNFGRCPAAPLPLIASSWHPDPYVAPHVIKSDLLLAKGGSSLPCTPDPITHVCPDPTKTPPADIDHTAEGGQLEAGSCDNGVTVSNPDISGPVYGPNGSNLTLSAGQICNYLTTSVIYGNLIINGAQVYIDGTLEGSLTVNSGRIVLGPSAHVTGNVQISQGAGNNFASGFTIGSSQNQAQIDGNLTIQNIPSMPIPENGGFMCNTRVGGSVTVQNNQTPSPIEIGETSSQQNCPGNTIGGSLTCTGNTPAPVSGQNTASHFLGNPPQCNG